MQIPNISLAYLIAELSPLLEGSILRKVQELENNWLKLKLQTRSGTKDLIIAPNIFFVTSYSLPAKQQSSGFGAFLRKKISNKKIISLKQHSLDRIALLEFDEFFLILELFAKGNVILATKDFEIVSAYRREQWKDRRISKQQQYKFPSSKGASPLETTAAELKKLLSGSSSDTVRTLVSFLNIAPAAAEEACLNAKVDKAKPAKKLAAAEAKTLLSSIQKLYKTDLRKLKPVVASETLLPFEMKSAGKPEKEFPSINTAVDELFAEEGAAKKADASPKKTKQNKLEKSLSNQVSSRKELEEKIEQYKKAGEAVYAHYSQINSALELARALSGGKIKKGEVMYKMSGLGLELKSIDLKNKKVTVNVKN